MTECRQLFVSERESQRQQHAAAMAFVRSGHIRLVDSTNSSLLVVDIWMNETIRLQDGDLNELRTMIHLKMIARPNYENWRSLL